MKDCYEKASIVWVLDSSLRDLSLDQGAERLFLRIASSTWLRRLWTFQEALFAKFLMFEFQSVGVTPESMWRVWRDRESKSVHILDRNLCTVQSTPGLRPPPAIGSPHRFVYLCEQLRWRSTSKAQDEPLCLATLLGLNVAEVLETPEDGRMIKMLSLQNDFPTDVLFWRVPRIREVGYRWSPSSFLSIPPSLRYWKHGISSFGKSNPRGLMATLEGFIFPSELTELSPTPRYFTTVGRAETFKFWPDDIPENEQEAYGMLGIVMRGPRPFNEQWEGVMVGINEVQDEVLYAGYIIGVQVEVVEKSKIVDSQALDANGNVIIEGVVWVKEGRQVWCVG
jgi:hypothetical protein